MKKFNFNKSIQNFKERQQDDIWICRGCGKNCKLDEKDYYMLKDELWLRLNGQEEGMLCMDCVEERLGRKLQAEDIHICPLTASSNPYTRKILLRAMTYDDMRRMAIWNTIDEDEIREKIKNQDPMEL